MGHYELAWPLLMARTDPIADASLPDIRARNSPGTPIAAMMPMIADDDQQLDERKTFRRADLHSCSVC